jgi:ActR/RegA family two-component response regulator
VQPPSVVIAANPYEAEMCRRALVETGLRVVFADDTEGALLAVREEKPLVLVLALGILGADPLELVGTVRGEQPALSIFLLADREGQVPDEDAAARLGATRLFLRPIDIESLADAIEKRAVEAEVAGEVAEAMAEFDVRPPTIDAAPLVEEAIVEMEADYEATPPPQPLARVALRRVPTEVMKAVIEVPAATPHLDATAAAPEPAAEAKPDAPPPSVAAPEPLMRADALGDVGLSSMAASPDFVMKESPRPAFDERSSFAKRLESELSAAERRLFPDSPSQLSSRDEYEDALGDIDLDALGIDTIPGVSNNWADALDASFELKPRNGHPGNGAPADNAAPMAPARRAALEPPTATLPDDSGDLANIDLATLLGALYGAGFTGAATLARGDGDKTIYFDAGTPVAARSSFASDRLAEMLLREGSITREQHARARELGDGGRATAQKLIELGVLKSSELFATVRRHAEEILYSLFAWERGRWKLVRGEAPAEERVRMSAHPWALIVEGIRRKYSLERLVDLVGPPETVLTPTTALARALDDGAFSPAERARAELIDGERTLAELQLGTAAAPLGEAGLYALAWGLCAIGAVRLGGDGESGVAVRPVPTLVTPPYGERRTRPRPVTRARDRDGDRVIDKERVLAKRAQVQDGDYFAVLGLPRDASAHEVARAFERLKREFALDRFADPLRAELADALGEIGEVLDEAHRVLADDAVRASYRSHLPPS